ncbi:hypothetical protein [Histidinibacterium lentulum]|uniref:17 kDa surface antigen n=1 Tax=Histidinibacterium lentulum TaxID=2480588 RepID=A0A3N2QM59_9RHOB|nr:hypothetical protein [Histidinibacterium lentulum]ROT96279.1 hypothetical protein EAT49_18740 [Histidinibacterium lentulum]
MHTRLSARLVSVAAVAAVLGLSACAPNPQDADRAATGAAIAAGTTLLTGGDRRDVAGAALLGGAAGALCDDVGVC